MCGDSQDACDREGATGNTSLLVIEAAQAPHAIEATVTTDDGLAVITTESGNPVIIFAEPLPKQDQFSVHRRRNKCNFGCEPKLSIPR